MELLRRMEDFTAAQDLANYSQGGRQYNVNVHSTAEVEDVETVLGLQENEAEVGSQDIIEDGLVDMELEQVFKEDGILVQQEEVEMEAKQNEEEPSLGQLVVLEEYPDQPGTYRLTLVEVAEKLNEVQVVETEKVMFEAAL